ncbi:MAG TPA: T9SS type A sorting domain-containing protein [Hymenobacter sp.]|jgi:hypothetical protein|uniref:T9SS type A sorting domain-containing protein n=1 Tax=Hymenobacter sp. TaxID=1898978 RepID=UPI002ED98EF5
MFKRYLLLSCAALLTYHSHAQTLPAVAVKMPGQVPGAPTKAARTTNTVSQLQELLVQNWSAGGGAWVDFSRQVYSRYATPTLPGTIRTDRKSGGAWAQSFAHRYRYTTAGQILSDSTDQYQQAPFGPYTASLFTFNTPSQVRWEWLKFQDPTNLSAPWDSIKRDSHTYNAAGQRTQVLEEFYTQGSFSAVARQLWSYNALGQVSVYETQTDGGGTWDPLQRATYTYNAAGKVQQYLVESADFLTGVYANSSRHTLTFDAQGREILLASEDWDNAWVPQSQTAYAYATNGDPTTATLQTWNPTASAYQNTQRIVLTYAQVTATRNALQASSQLAVAPNPGTEGLVHYTLLAPATTSVEVLDLTGRRVAVVQAAAAQTAGAHAVSLAGTALAPGLYVVRLRAGAQHAQVKWDKR